MSRSSAVVFGATGQLGLAAAEVLLRRGWHVTVVSRDGRPPLTRLLKLGAQPVDGTGRSRQAVLNALERPVDAVFDPTAYTEDDARDLLAARARYGGLVVVSSSSVYADHQGRSLDEAATTGFPVFERPMTEETATVEAGPQTYSTRKVAMERTLLAADVQASILRPCAVYGELARHPREWWFIKRALDGRRAIPLAYGADSLFHTSSAVGVASLAALCLESPATRVLNVADLAPLSVRGIAAVISEATGLPVRLAPFEGAPIGPTRVGGSPWSTPHPFVLDTTKARALGWDGGVYRNSATTVCRWILGSGCAGDWRDLFSTFTRYGYDPFDYAAEDRFLRLARVES